MNNQNAECSHFLGATRYIYSHLA